MLRDQERTQALPSRGSQATGGSTSINKCFSLNGVNSQEHSEEDATEAERGKWSSARRGGVGGGVIDKGAFALGLAGQVGVCRVEERMVQAEVSTRDKARRCAGA